MWTDNVNRRAMLRRMCAGFGMLSFTSLLEQVGRGVSAEPLFRSPHIPARARRAIFLFMNGGPSHVDTFDPKPALAKYAGQQPEGELYKKEQRQRLHALASHLQEVRPERHRNQRKTSGRVPRQANRNGEHGDAEDGEQEPESTRSEHGSYCEDLR